MDNPLASGCLASGWIKAIPGPGQVVWTLRRCRMHVLAPPAAGWRHWSWTGTTLGTSG